MPSELCAATIGNLRTAVAAQSSLGKGFQLALNSGAVMGFALVSLAVLGFVLIYLFTRHFLPTADAHILYERLFPFLQENLALCISLRCPKLPQH